MKIRDGFVSNSSSTSFTFRNKSNESKTLVDFVKENAHLIDKFNDYYDYEYTLEECVKDAEGQNITFSPKDECVLTFSDHDGPLGHVYDYILRDGGESDNFEWSFYEMNR
jgi:hypothetical protein